MATANFNSMPQNVTYGARDKSVPDPILTAKQYATHLPLWFIFALKGPSTRVVADGPTREQLFGTSSFDPSSPYFTHATQFANQANSKGNQSIYQRVVPADAKTAQMRLWLDLLPLQVPEYQRGTDGKYLLDTTGNPIPTGSKVAGYQLKFVKTIVDATTGGEFGQASQMQGDQTDVTSGTQSTRYPFVDIPVSFAGLYGDDLGFRAWAPVAGSRVVPDSELIETNKAYPFVFACLDRSSDTAQNVQTTAGTQEVTCVFRRNQVKASVGNQDVSFESRFYDSYNDRERTGLAPLYGPFDNVHLYYDNLVTVLKKLYDAEKPLIDAWSDFDGSGYTTTDEGEIFRFNFIGGKSSAGAPYHSFIINRNDANAEAMSDISTVWADGGADGDISLDNFNRLVQAEMEAYGDSDQEVTDDRLGNPQSIFWDSGFDSDCKMAMANFIGVRKDTQLVWCLQDAQAAQPLTADEESSMAIALFTRAQQMPESSEYGTSAIRAMIVACDGILIGSTNRNRLPLSLELLSKSAEYMGAGNGLWNSAFSFSHGSRAEVTLFRDVNVVWRPLSARQRDWANGMVYVQKKDMDTLFFPGLRTVYAVDQSIFTSFINSCVLVDLQKVADRVWSQFSGADEYTNEQFKKYVEQEFKTEIEGKYDNRVTVVPTVSFSAVDEYNGYSWTLNIDMGADNMKTVQYTVLTGYRQESMPASN